MSRWSRLFLVWYKLAPYPPTTLPTLLTWRHLTPHFAGATTENIVRTVGTAYWCTLVHPAGFPDVQTNDDKFFHAAVLANKCQLLVVGGLSQYFATAFHLLGRTWEASDTVSLVAGRSRPRQDIARHHSEEKSTASAKRLAHPASGQFRNRLPAIVER
jgi:hypothetical protein